MLVYFKPNFGRPKKNHLAPLLGQTLIYNEHIFSFFIHMYTYIFVLIQSNFSLLKKKLAFLSGQGIVLPPPPPFIADMKNVRFLRLPLEMSAYRFEISKTKCRTFSNDSGGNYLHLGPYLRPLVPYFPSVVKFEEKSHFENGGTITNWVFDLGDLNFLHRWR